MQSPARRGITRFFGFAAKKWYGAPQTDVALPAAVFYLVSHALHRVF